MYSAIEIKRKELNLRQEDVAESAGISRQYYNSIENARVEPTVAVAKKLGKVLGVEWTIFFTNGVNI